MATCNGSEHDFIVVYSATDDAVGEALAVVRWCRYCGGVVVDLDVDGRVMRPGGRRKIEFPQLAWDHMKCIGSPR